MHRALEDFVRALRACEVRVSPAEAIDAHRAVAEVGFASRELLKDALAVTLAKNADEVARFETCFDTFFARSPFAGDSPEDSAGDEANLEQMLEAGDQAALAQAMEAAAGAGRGRRHPAQHPARPDHPPRARRDGPARAGDAHRRPARFGRTR